VQPAATSAVESLITFDDGSGSALFAAGSFTSVGGVDAHGIARWDGAQWRAIGSPLSPIIQAVSVIRAQTVFDDGSGPELYTCGVYSHSIVFYPFIARWDGCTGWTSPGSIGPIGVGQPYVCTLLTFNDGSGAALYAGGSFTSAGGVPALDIVKWNGMQFSPLGSGIPGSVEALGVFDDGSGPALYAGGTFTSAGGVSAANIAKWNGTSWSPLGAGVDGTVKTLVAFQDSAGSSLFVGGSFSNAGGNPAPFAARWNGSSWSTFEAPGAGMDGEVDSSFVFDDGSGPRLYAGGVFQHAGTTTARFIARWDDGVWSRLDNANLSVHPVIAMAAFNDGHDGDADLYVGGAPTFNPLLAEWHGCGVTAFCAGDGSVVPCPCANNGAVDHGCNNSAATGGAVLAASGTTSPDTLVLTQAGELGASLSIFLQGDVSLGTPVGFGDGLRCVSGSLKRLYSKNASSGVVSAPTAGDPSITARSALLGDPIAPGSTRSYQVYYRDPALSFCPAPAGDAFNVGNALRVVW